MKVEDFAYNKFIAITNKIENASYIDFANTNAANQYIPSIINKAIFIDKNMSLLDSYQKYLGRLENPWERAAVGSVKNIMFLSSVAFQKKLSETLIEQGFASEQASDIFSETFVAEEINASLALSKAAQFGFLNKLNYSPYGKFLALAWIEQSTNNSLYVKSIGVTKVVQVVLNSGTWIRQILSDGVAAFTFGGFDKNPLNAGRLLSATVAMQRAYRFGTPVTKDERFKDNFEQLLTPETIKKFGSVDAVINLIMAAGVFEENIVAKDILNSLGENQTAFSPLSTIGFVKNTKELYKNIIKGEFTKEAFAKVQKQGLKDSRSYVKSTVSNIGYFFGTTNNAGRLAVALKFINSFSASTFTPQEIVGISYQLTHSVVPRFENYPEMIKLATRYGIFNPYIFFEYMGTRGLFNQLKNLSMMQKKVDFEKLVGRPITEEELKVTKELSHTLLLQLVIGLGLNYFLIFGNPFGDDEEEENKLSQANKSNIDKLLSGFLTSKNYKFKYDFKTRELQLISREYASYFAPAIFATKYGVMGLTQLYNEISEPGDWDYDKSSASGGIRTLTDLTRTKLTQNVISPLTQLGTMVLSGRDIRTGQYLGDIREDGRNATIVEKIVPAFKATLEANSPPDIKRINKILEDKMEIKDWVELATLGQSTYRVQLDKFWSGSIYQETQNLRNVISDFGKNVNELEEGENIDFNIKRHSKNYIINRDVIIEKSKYLQGSGLVNQDEFVKYITGNYGSKTPLINDSELQVYSIYGTQFVLDSLNEIEGENSLEIKTWAIKHYLNDLPIDKQVDIITNQTSDRFKTLFESGKMGSSATFNGQPITEYSWESFDLKTKQDIVSHFNKSFAWLYAGMKINEEQDKDEQYKYISDISADGTTEIRETPDSRSLTKLKKDLIEDSSNISPKTVSSYGFLNEEEKLQTIYRIKYGINELVKQGKSIKGSLVVDSKGNFIFSGTDSERRDIERTLQFMLLKTFKSGDSKDITKNRLGFKNVSSADAADFGFFDREKHPKTNKETVFVDKNSDIAKVFTTKELIENIINNIPLVVESKTTITTRGRR